jgi:hypothetical protein
MGFVKVHIKSEEDNVVIRRLETDMASIDRNDFPLILHCLGFRERLGAILCDAEGYQLCDVGGFELFAQEKVTPAPPSQYYLHVSPSETMWLTSDDIIYEVTSNTEWEIK